MIIFSIRTNYVSVFSLVVVICNCYLMSAFFVDLHANAAEALALCYLTENNL